VASLDFQAVAGIFAAIGIPLQHHSASTTVTRFSHSVRDACHSSSARHQPLSKAAESFSIECGEGESSRHSSASAKLSLSRLILQLDTSTLSSRIAHPARS
jgi:hypothetical protein